MTVIGGYIILLRRNINLWFRYIILMSRIEKNKSLGYLEVL